MFRWTTQSRLRTALAIIFFVALFAVSVVLLAWSFAFHATAFPGPFGSSGLTGILGLTAAVVSILGTISTVILAWRADRRTAKESDLKVIQLQQQIAEMQEKLSQQQVTQPSSLFPL
ncbi:MAG TPA: hypothetical protein VK814_11230 [Acidobacteriaceae bacterium]|nr:hypothetical protein [Acidobacteriaceae bacterium]